jgi:hypothetical protein
MNPSAVITPRATGGRSQPGSSPNTPRGESSKNMAYLWDTPMPETKNVVFLCHATSSAICHVCDEWLVFRGRNAARSFRFAGQYDTAHSI